MKKIYFIILTTIALTSYSQTNCIFTENATSSNISSDGESTYGVRSGDLNNDGYIDIISIHNHDQIQVKINDGTGVFENANHVYTGGDYFRVELADVDNDSYLDIVAFSFGTNGKTDIWKNNGNAEFTLSQTISTGLYANHSKLADLDNDGYLDIFETVRLDDLDQKIYKNDGTGHFTLFSTITPNTYNKSSVALADFDNDGDIDAFISSASSTSDNELWINDGNANFSYVASYHDNDGSSYYGIDHGDFNNDGFEDVVFLVQYKKLDIYLNDGAGNFTYNNSIGTDAYRNEILVRDINNDGKDDIVAIGATTEVLINNGNAEFNICWSDDSSFNYSFDINDFDGDNLPDLYLGTSSQGTDRVFIQSPSTLITALQNSENICSIFPNPSSGNFNINYKLKTNGKVELSILSINGTLLKTLFSEKQIKGNHNLNINNLQLEAGNYIIKIKTQNYISIKQLIIIK